MEDARIGALILAAGKGTRMNSSGPKVLQEILGSPMLSYVYEALIPIFEDKIWTVVGHQADLVAASFPAFEHQFILQEEQLGTGHALQVALPYLIEADLTHVLVISGDIPLITTDSLATFLTAMSRTTAPFGFITLTLPSSGSYGIVLRDRSEVIGIVEAKDYSPLKHGTYTGEINTGIYLINIEKLGCLLPHLSNDNNSSEYYITDLVDLSVRSGLEVVGAQTGDISLLGVNTLAELVRSEDRLRMFIVREWLQAGAAIHHATSVIIGPHVIIDLTAHIQGPCHLLGNTAIEAGARIEPFCMIKDSIVGANSQINAFSHLEKSVIHEGCVVGPYARLRPGSELEDGSKVGNFVEMKKAKLGKGAKANHLSYVGDAEVGDGANIGAGTITCNYDGKNKFQTKIGEGAFIGSNTALVAPVKIGKNALVAAGSVITTDVPDDAIAFGRARQTILEKKQD